MGSRSPAFDFQLSTSFGSKMFLDTGGDLGGPQRVLLEAEAGRASRHARCVREDSLRSARLAPNRGYALAGRDRPPHVDVRGGLAAGRARRRLELLRRPRAHGPAPILGYTWPGGVAGQGAEPGGKRAPRDPTPRVRFPAGALGRGAQPRAIQY